MTEREQYILARHRKGRKAVEDQIEDYCICAHCITIVHNSLVQNGEIPKCPVCHAYRFEQNFDRMEARLYEMRTMSDKEILWWATNLE